MGFAPTRVGRLAREVGEVLRAWPQATGRGSRPSGRGWTARPHARYVAAAESAGLSRHTGTGAVTEDLVGAVVEAVRPARPKSPSDTSRVTSKSPPRRGFR